jgi:cellobiose phosphorylase
VAYRDGLPKAVRERRMGGSGLCLAEKSAFALESIIEIAPGAEAECLWLAGRYEKEEDIIAMLARAKTAAPETTAFPQPLDIRTGDAVFDHWCATWLQRQLAYNATWARDYFNGYRDLCQDVENLAIFDPQRAREKLLEILSYQYASGFAPRAWFNGKALDHGHGDSPVWIVFAVHALVCETGDLGLLDEIVPYYEKTESGSVMDHCRRVIDWYWNDRGENGLCLFRKGDWNDAMIAMGARGKGTSAWTTMAYHRALLEFAELASWMGADHTANEALQRAGTIRETIENVAWDGGWYLRGFTDDGDPVGSAKNAEGAIYANTQSWAVIGDAAPAERLRAAMAALDQQLEGDTGVRTLHNHYTRFDPAIGPITGQIPGFYQNGSIYMHTNMFKLTADCLLGRAEEAWAGIWKLLPFSTARIQTWGEPYVLPNCYFGPAAGYRHDRTGQSWMTASAGWLARILSRHLFGLQPAPDGLHIRPCLPHACDSWTINRRFRGAVYRVSCRRDPETTGGTRILVDGAPLDGDLLPHAPGGEFEVSVLLPWGK